MELAVRKLAILLAILLVVNIPSSCRFRREKPGVGSTKEVLVVKTNKMLHREIKKAGFITNREFLALIDTTTEKPFGKYKYFGQLVNQKLTSVEGKKKNILFETDSQKDKIYDFDVFNGSVYVLKRRVNGQAYIFNLTKSELINEIDEPVFGLVEFFIVPNGIIYKGKINEFKQTLFYRKGTGKIKSIFSASAIYSVAISKDRKKLAISNKAAQAGNKYNLHILDLQTLKLHRLNVPLKSWIKALDFSPNSEWLAFSREGYEELKLLRISDLETFDISNLSTDYSISWAPTSRRLLLNNTNALTKVDLILPDD